MKCSRLALSGAVSIVVHELHRTEAAHYHSSGGDRNDVYDDDIMIHIF